mmetsp:Transcript_19762/g.28639  ORF Transcript_19762/g.28639 Transcript_19762/m.28639 type:complete len:397 (-) Transcript_19762:1098-2288(-)
MSRRDSNGSCNTEIKSKAHRILFSVHDESSDGSSASKTVSWRFELLRGVNGGKQEWEEHMIRLLWAPNSSGIVHVTLLLSKSICPPSSSWGPDTARTLGKDSVVEFSWKCHSCQDFRVVAYSVPSPVFRQYDLWINGVSFFDLEERNTKSQASFTIGKPFDESTLQDFRTKEQTTSLSMDTLPHNTPISNSADKDTVENQSQLECSTCVEDVCSSKHYKGDDIHSESSIVDPLGERYYPMHTNLVSCEPRTSIESRAIHTAFSDEEHIQWIQPYTDGSVIEASVLCDAYDFMRQRALSPESALEKANDRVSFLHNQLTQMVNNVRFGAMPPIAAARTIHSIEMITGLAEFPAIWEVTVVFFGLGDTTTSLDIRTAMEQFGEIEAAGVADGGRGFGM